MLMPIYPPTHSSIHPSTHPLTGLFVFPTNSYLSYNPSRKKENEGLLWKGGTPMGLDTVLQKESFLANNAISLGICSPALL